MMPRHDKSHNKKQFINKINFLIIILILSTTCMGGVIAMLLTPIYLSLINKICAPNRSCLHLSTTMQHSFKNNSTKKFKKLNTTVYKVSLPLHSYTNDKQTVITKFFTTSQTNKEDNTSHNPQQNLPKLTPNTNTLPPPPPTSSKRPSSTNNNHNDPNSHFFSICSHNITTVAAHSDNPQLRSLKSKIIKNLMTNFPVVCLQETKLLARAPNHLNFPNHTTYYNCNPNNIVDDIRKCTAGTAIIINNNILKHNTVTPIQLHKQLEGHIQMVIITNNNTKKTTKIVNIRLLSTLPNNTTADTTQQRGSITNLQNTQLKLLRRSNAPSTDFTYLMGDFNFVDNKEDTSTSFDTDYSIEKRIPSQWHKLLKDYKLHEVPQPLHTYFQINDSTEHSSKLDRIYISHDEADYELVKPTAFTHVTPYTSITTSFNQHIPVGISFNNILPDTSQKRKTIPHWIAEDESFPLIFNKLYTPNNQKLRTHYSRLQYFKQTCFRASKTLIKLQAQKNSKLHLLQSCIKLRRIIHAPNANTKDIIRFLIKHPRLTPLVHQDINYTWNTDKLKRLINKIYAKEGEVQPHLAPPHEPSIPPPSHEVHNLTAKPKIPMSKYLKMILPSSRERITHLRKTIITYTRLVGSHLGYAKHTTATAPTNDPTILGEIIHDYWSKVWEAENFHDTAHRAKIINSYLSKYTKKVNHNKIKNISLQSISNAIQHSGNTLHGPDGIPFAVWRALSTTASPLLFNTAIHLTGQHVNVRTHNHAMLLLLPKPNKDSHLVSDTRPLSISNTDNRIIARAVLGCIIEATKELVDTRQNGFIPGRKMTDNIHKLNKAFYTALAPNLNNIDNIEDDQLFILFVDNEKAFDSIHHDFIHATLKQQDWPFWFRNIAFNLLKNVSLTPTLSPHIKIPVQRGVKQGCPLSPIIFVIIYDVLITNLVSSLDTSTIICGAADDLAVASHTIEHITASFHIIDEFALVSGLRVNRNKTQILSTIDNADDNNIFPPYFPIHTVVKAIQNSTWPLVQLVNDAKYLGIKFSNLFSHNNNSAAFAAAIFSDCFDKAKQRIKRYYPSLKTMSMHQKILTINIFVSPIFSYLNEFYIIPARTYYAYTMLICKTVIPYRGTGFKYEHLVCPASKMGPHTPLQDIWIANITRLIYPLITKLNAQTTPWGYNTDRKGKDHEGVFAFPTLIEHNQNLAVMEFLSEKFLDWNGTDELSSLTKKMIKDTLIEKQFNYWSDLQTRENKFLTGHNRQKDLQSKFLHFSTNQHTELTLEHFSHINKKIPPCILNHHLKLYTNSLATDRRIRHFAPNASVHPDADVINPHPCYLCNIHNTLIDDGAAHIYRECVVVKHALALLRSLNHIDKYFYRSILNCLKQSPLFHMQYMVDTNKKKYRVNFILCFNYSIWRIRRRARQGHIGNTHQMAQRIVDHTISLKHLWHFPSKN